MPWVEAEPEDHDDALHVEHMEVLRLDDAGKELGYVICFYSNAPTAYAYRLVAGDPIRLGVFSTFDAGKSAVEDCRMAFGAAGSALSKTTMGEPL
jgi:hypothetical protein